MRYTPLHTRQPAQGSGLSNCDRTSARATGANLHGREVRKQVQRILDTRTRCNGYGWGNPNVELMRTAMRPLQDWMRTNLYPSPGTLRLFWAKYETNLRMVATTNKQGQNSLRELEQLIRSL